MSETSVRKIAFTIAGLLVFGWAWAFGIPAVMKAQPVSETSINEVKSQQTPEHVVTNYEKHIRPIFEAKCAQCHAGRAARFSTISPWSACSPNPMSTIHSRGPG